MNGERLQRTLVRFGADVLDVIAPRGCAGCGAPDEVLCTSCRYLFSGVHKTLLGVSGESTCFCCALYEGRVRTAILAWKDHNDEECSRPFADALVRLVLDVLPTLAVPHTCAVPPKHVPGAEGGLVVVPAPSSSRSMRRRGRDHLLPVARLLVAGLRRYGINARVSRSLRMRNTSSKSVQTQGAAGRSRRIEGHVELIASALPPGCDVLLVDDIVTTGATMRQCMQVLEKGGAQVLTGLALAGSTGGLSGESVVG